MVAILKTVFQRRHADVLFSTMRELFFYHKDAENVTYEKPESEEETLEKIRAIAEREDLPFITVVRDRGLPGSTKVFLIYDRVVFPLNVPSGNLPRRNNVFNAAFLSELVSKDTDMVNRSKFLKEVANNALKLWIQDNS